MFAVIFAVQPKPDQWEHYLDLAKQLRPELERIEGFVENERYRSRRTGDRLLSLSIWANEKAVIRWRTQAMHHAAQEKGRFDIFEDYHLRVGEITADSKVPPDQRLEQMRFDGTEIGAAPVVSLVELNAQILPHSLQVAGGAGVHDSELFDSIATPGKLLFVISWRDSAAAESWLPPDSLLDGSCIRHRRVRVIRDYGLTDRREAPQFYPAVARQGVGG
jgi:heme-degrading monooxygenase HmoA